MHSESINMKLTNDAKRAKRKTCFNYTWFLIGVTYPLGLQSTVSGRSPMFDGGR